MDNHISNTNDSFRSQSNTRRAQTRDFYSSTINALGVQDASDDATRRKLEEVRQGVKLQPHAGNRPQSFEMPKATSMVDIPGEADGEEKSVAGRKKMLKGGERWDMATGKEAAMVVDKIGDDKDSTGGRAETKEEHEVEVELNSILKKGPSKYIPTQHMLSWSTLTSSPRQQ